MLLMHLCMYIKIHNSESQGQEVGCMGPSELVTRNTSVKFVNTPDKPP